MVGIMTLSMNEETTKGLPDKRSFEERVFARFDAMDARFEAIDARFDSVDARFTQIDNRFDAVESRLEKLEARSFDTKPIWERALAAITQISMEVREIKTKVEAIETKVEAIETRVEAIENRLGTVESDVAGIRSDYASLLESQQNFKKKIVRRIDLLLETLVDTHENQRNSDARLTLLESKLA